METANLRVEDIPGYREAVEREGKIRSAAFDDDSPEFICGIEVKSLNLTHILRLKKLNSPFICGGAVPMPKHVLVFLWCVSPDYEAALRFRNSAGVFLPWLGKFVFSRMRNRFARRLRRVKYIQSVQEIARYVNEAYQDSPPTIAQGFTAPYYAGVTSIVCTLAEKLYLPKREIMVTPLKCIFQYHRWLETRSNPGAVLFNPSDKDRRLGFQKLVEGN